MQIGKAITMKIQIYCITVSDEKDNKAIKKFTFNIDWKIF
jgi:hypothetical protein